MATPLEEERPSSPSPALHLTEESPEQGAPDITTTTTTTTGEAAAEPQQPSFQPIFTLLTNTTTNTTIHPQVRYLFSDDDQSAIHDDPSQRSIVVDLVPQTSQEPDGSSGEWKVSWASSTSPDFAVTDTDLSLQQADGAAVTANTGAATTMMLRVQGVTREPPLEEMEMRTSGSGSGSAPGSNTGSGAIEDMQVLADEFKRRVGVMKHVVDASEKRRAEVLSRQELDQAHTQEQSPSQSHEPVNPDTEIENAKQDAPQDQQPKISSSIDDIWRSG